MTHPDWPAIEAAYRDGDCTVVQILSRYGISQGQLYSRARRNGWPARRKRLPVRGAILRSTARPDDISVSMLSRLSRSLAVHIDELESAALQKYRILFLYTCSAKVLAYEDRNLVITVLAVSIKPPSMVDFVAVSWLVTHFTAIGDEKTVAAMISMVANRAVLAQRYIEKFGRPHPVYGDGTWRQACIEVDLRLLDRHMPASRAHTEAMALAASVEAGKIPDRSRGSTRCHRHDTEPIWATSARPRAIVGEFLFYQTCEI